MKHLKDPIRKEMLSKRDSLDKDQINILSEAIKNSLFSRPRFNEARTVAFYIPKGKEVDTIPMIEQALGLKKEVLVPVTDHKITFYKYLSKDDLVPGKYGILEPKTRTTSDDPDVIIVPGVSFGLCMHRLGYGKGYYDQFLSTSHAYRIGIGYDFQVVEKLPSHENDERMDEIITDKRIILM